MTLTDNEVARIFSSSARFLLFPIFPLQLGKISRVENFYFRHCTFQQQQQQQRIAHSWFNQNSRA
jgi:hypothetical protein